MRKIVLTTIVMGSIFIGCSKEDEPKCDSCEFLGAKAEICDNKDGTYTFSVGGESEKITQEDLDLLGFTAKEYVEFVCALGE